jgi:hypothetical protein
MRLNNVSPKVALVLLAVQEELKYSTDSNNCRFETMNIISHSEFIGT